MLNVFALMGRLVAEPELRHTQSGVPTCAFRIAVDSNHKAVDGNRPANFFEIITWRQTAEFVAQYFHKGSLIAVDGSIQQRNYEDKNGNKRSVVEFVAEHVSFCESKKDGARAEPAEKKAEFEPVDDGEDTPF